jgi:hypothetical protein
MRDMTCPLWRRGVVLLLSGLLTACGAARAIRPKLPTAYGTPTRFVERNSLFVVDWDPSQVSSLDALLHNGKLSVVSYRSGRLRVLRDCAASGSYLQTRQTPYMGRLVLRDLSAAQLSAAMPGQETQLSAAVATGTSLHYDFVIVGRYDWQSLAPAPTLATLGEASREACAGATHFVRTTYLGAFRRTGEASAGAAAGASFGGLGAGGASTSQAQLTAQGGDYARCVAQRSAVYGIPPECAALLKVELEPIAAGRVDLVLETFQIQGQVQPAYSFRLATPRGYVGVTPTYSAPYAAPAQTFPGVEITEDAPLTVEVFNTLTTGTQAYGRARVTLADLRKRQFVASVFHESNPAPVGNIQFRVTAVR